VAAGSTFAGPDHLVPSDGDDGAAVSIFALGVRFAHTVSAPAALACWCPFFLPKAAVHTEFRHK